MWEMLESDGECDECGGIGPPPKFLIPPPPRPPFLQELSNDCSEDPLPDIEMCDAISILDINYHTELSFQASAVIVLFSLILVLVIIISTIFVWKHKRKVQNFLPCKTPTRGGHLNSTGASGHSVTYEDPDVHIGHRPLVMRHHHHNMEMLHPKTIHYPSGYPMPRSPPLFICSSPGPDPYRSHDNVYEELEHQRETDSEPPLQSDDDFAEDELSLPGDRSLNKSSPDTTTVATIYHERSTSSSNGGTSGNGNDSSSTYLERNRMERNSLLSTSSSGNDNTRQLSSNNNNNRNSNSSNECIGLFRSRKLTQQQQNVLNNTNSHNNSTSSCNRNNNNKLPNNYSVDELNTTNEHNTTDLLPPTTIYDDRSIIPLPPPSYNSVTSTNNSNLNCGSGSLVNNSTSNNNNHHHHHHTNHSVNTPSLRNNYYSSIDVDSEVERRNRINSQLSNNSVATIYRERNARYPIYHPQHNNQNHHTAGNRSRTQPRPSDRRRCGDIAVQEPSYMYQEPIFHEGLLYDSCLAHSYNNRSNVYPYILPEFSSFRHSNVLGTQPQQPPSQPPTSTIPQQQFQSPYSIVPSAINANNVASAIYASRNPSSFGSDSGYHTASHNNNGNNNNTTTQSSANRNFWNRKKKDKTNVSIQNQNGTGTYDGS